MKSFDDVIESICRYRRIDRDDARTLEVIERYRATHDVSLLSRLKPRDDMEMVFLSALNECLPLKGVLNEDQIDALRVLIASRNWYAFTIWVRKRLVAEEPEEDIIEMVLSQVRALRVPWEEAMDELLYQLPLLGPNGQPNSFGRLVATLRPDDVVQMVVEGWESRGKPDIVEKISSAIPADGQAGNPRNRRTGPNDYAGRL